MKLGTDSIVGIAVLLGVAGLLVWLNVSAYLAWKNAGTMKREGTEASATVLDLEESKMTRSMDSYWATVKWYVPGKDGYDKEYQGRLQVGEELFRKLEKGGKTTVVYPESNPQQAEIVGNTRVATRVWVTIFIDASILIAFLFILWQSKKG